MASCWLRSAITLSLALSAASAQAHDTTIKAEPTAQAEAEATVPLYDNLGNLSYPISTQSEQAQRYFDQGLRLTYAFNHQEALKAFREAQRLDPDSALSYWGEAFVLGPNINAPMDAAADNPAVAAIRKAMDLAHHAKPHEQALIESLSLRYATAPEADRAALNEAYAVAMLEAARRFPDDQEIGVLAMDAIMNTSPWDYWEADGVTPKGRIGEAIAIAERVLAANPDHPGAIHLYIHLTEASNNPSRAEVYADRLANLMPGAGHLVHMASHVYFRIGRYHDSTEINKQAVQVDEEYLAQAEDSDAYAHSYYPHNIHFVVASAQVEGDGVTAMEYAKRLDGKIPEAVAAQVGWIQAILTAPYFVHAQFTDAEQVLALAEPEEDFPFIKAMWHYARAVAWVQQGDLEQARAEAAAIDQLKRDGDYSMLLAWAVPAPDILDLARHVVEGRIAMAEDDPERAIREFGIAVTIQDSLSYMEPPFWYYPVRQSLGAALLLADRAEEAEQAFIKALEDFPNNALSLYGLMQAQQAQDKLVAARESEEKFRRAWNGGDQKIEPRHM